MQPKKSDLEANAQGEEAKRATSCCLARNETPGTKHRSLELCISGRANLAKVLQEFYAEVQLENVSL